ncbi:hypothetical protein ACNKHW_23210 [Shigella flexneri]
MIQLTGVASRDVGYVVALMLIVLGVLVVSPDLCSIFRNRCSAELPSSCSGTIAASGVRISSHENPNRLLITIKIALSLAVGTGVSQQPLILEFAPGWSKPCSPPGSPRAVLLPSC